MRIRTLQFAVARNIHEIYDSVDTEAILSILVHKVCLTALGFDLLENYNGSCYFLFLSALLK